MPNNNFKAFAGASGANVITQAEYEALATILANGFQSGIALSEQLNKVWRQSSIGSYLLGQLINDVLGSDALDDGNLATLLANLKSALSGRVYRTLVYTNVSGVQYVSINGANAVTAGASTYMPSAAMTRCDVEVQGGGGGGGGAANPNSGTLGISAPGASGSYGKSIFSAAQIGASQSVVVGAGGSAGVGAAAGGNGAVSSIGTLITAPGGPGGTFVSNANAPYVLGQLTSIPSPPTGANIVASTGRGGGPSIAVEATKTVTSYGGQGGGTVFGPPGSFVATNVNGIDATTIGGGGSGLVILNGAGPAQGGKGASGIVIIREIV